MKAWLAVRSPDASPDRGFASVRLRRESLPKVGDNTNVLGELRGDITVPPGKLLMLSIALPAEGSLDLSWLSQFAPDDLHSLSILSAAPYSPYALPTDKSSQPKLRPAGDIMPYVMRLTGLRRLSLDGVDLTDKDRDQLAELKNLEQLPFFSIDLTRMAPFRNLRTIHQLSNPTDEDLARLVGFPLLEKLRITGGLGWTLTDAGLAHLAKLPHLQSLSLQGERITDACMAQVARISSLRFLDISDQRITDAGLAHLAKAPALEGLNLNNTLVTDDGLAHLKSLRTLKVLNLVTGRPIVIRPDNRPRITRRALVHLSQIKSLEYFDLDTDEKDLDYLCKLPNLKSLRAGKSDAALERISNLTSLEELYTRGPDITDAGVAHLAKLKNLRTLVIVAPLTDQSLGHLTSLSSLRSLKIMGGSRISMSGLRQLSKLPNLICLHIYDDLLPDGSALDLSGLTALEDLMLTTDPKTPFTDRDLATILKLKNLRRLDLTGEYTAEAKARVTRLPSLVSWAGVLLTRPEWNRGFTE
ncbi:MAG: hypothetical protein GX616_01815 [Planctomycetes bacterium]|nr:hypothetical protein [Planctomycetota bacterium]